MKAHGRLLYIGLKMMPNSGMRRFECRDFPAEEYPTVLVGRAVFSIFGGEHVAQSTWTAGFVRKNGLVAWSLTDARITISIADACDVKNVCVREALFGRMGKCWSLNWKASLEITDDVFGSVRGKPRHFIRKYNIDRGIGRKEEMSNGDLRT